MRKSVVAAAVGVLAGLGLLFTAMPGSAAPMPAPAVHQDGGSSGGCC
ncbi:hypothetical protein [Kitasatospora sp. HPMI-4]